MQNKLVIGMDFGTDAVRGIFTGRNAYLAMQLTFEAILQNLLWQLG